MFRIRLIVLGLLVASASTQAFDLEQAEQQALAADPGLEALAAEARALNAEAIAAGQLPDPQLTLGVMNLPVPDFSLNAEPMAQAQVGVMQRFPARAQRRARTGIKQAEAATVTGRLAVRSLEVRREVRKLWMFIQHQASLLALEHEMASVLDRLTELLDARMRVDRAYQTAVLSSRARRARIEKRLGDRRASITEARAALGEWLDPVQVPPELEPAAPTPPETIPIEDHPALTVARLGLEEADRKVALADAGFRPGWSVNFGVGRRFGDVPLGAPSETLINATVAIDLPLFTRNRQSRRLEAAREQVRAAAAGPVEVRRQLAARYRAASGTYAEFAELVALYNDSVLPLAREQEEAAEIQYRTGREELDPALEARLARLETERELVELKLARDQSAIDLLYLGGR